MAFVKGGGKTGQNNKKLTVDHFSNKVAKNAALQYPLVLKFLKTVISGKAKDWTWVNKRSVDENGKTIIESSLESCPVSTMVRVSAVKIWKEMHIDKLVYDKKDPLDKKEVAEEVFTKELERVSSELNKMKEDKQGEVKKTEEKLIEVGKLARINEI